MFIWTGSASLFWEIAWFSWFLCTYCVYLLYVLCVLMLYVLLFLLTPSLGMAVQPCMEWIPIKKGRVSTFFICRSSSHFRTYICSKSCYLHTFFYLSMPFAFIWPYFYVTLYLPAMSVNVLCVSVLLSILLSIYLPLF